ncbi:conserved hypothetical protein [Treponema phagedenis]|uniref:Uncharacterized protein n=1 Tax=Treponema phagedenis TaxID=162 RepID=A0A0B7GQN9_TREPH|nr:conserved hypothetical protein [Treponema phagedenis]
MAVVPRRNDVLKQDCLQSFKTRRFDFDKDVKNSERARTPVLPCRSDVLKQNYLQSFKTRKVWF